MKIKKNLPVNYIHSHTTHTVYTNNRQAFKCDIMFIALKVHKLNCCTFVSLLVGILIRLIQTEEK